MKKAETDDSTAYKKRTIETYNALASDLAEGYDQHFEHYARLEAEYFLAKLPTGSKILDLGCGVGSASKYFVQQSHQPVSTDLSQAMLKECQNRGLGHLVCLDLEALPFANASFDGIWAHTSLIHIPKRRVLSVMGSLVKILKPNGTLFIALREGENEGYQGQPGMERWFANYQANEFDDYIPSGYAIKRFNRIARESITFLNYHLV